MLKLYTNSTSCASALLVRCMLKRCAALFCALLKHVFIIHVLAHYASVFCVFVKLFLYGPAVNYTKKVVDV